VLRLAETWSLGQLTGAKPPIPWGSPEATEEPLLCVHEW
jgi:hypothetical protein